MPSWTASLHCQHCITSLSTQHHFIVNTASLHCQHCIISLSALHSRLPSWTASVHCQHCNLTVLSVGRASHVSANWSRAHRTRCWQEWLKRHSPVLQSRVHRPWSQEWCADTPLQMLDFQEVAVTSWTAETASWVSHRISKKLQWPLELRKQHLGSVTRKTCLQLHLLRTSELPVLPGIFERWTPSPAPTPCSAQLHESSGPFFQQGGR